MTKEMRLSKNIKYLRELHKFTQGELAHKIGVSQVTVSQYENKDRKPSLQVLVLLADTFNTSLEGLVFNHFEGVCDQHPPQVHELTEMGALENIIVDGLRLSPAEIKLGINYIRFIRLSNNN